MKIAMSKTREQFPLSQKKPLKKTMPGIISAVIQIVLFLSVGLIAASFFSWPLGLVLLIIISYAILLFLSNFLMYQYQKWYFQVYFYDVTDNFIVIRKRVFTPREITIPYERIQDVYVDQDLLDRIFGLYDVHLSSATISSGMEAHIDGVEKAAAGGLRKIILEKVSEKIKRPTGGKG
jgi:membrane protein YdbS with pleckstrin-like domain